MRGGRIVTTEFGPAAGWSFYFCERNGIKFRVEYDTERRMYTVKLPDRNNTKANRAHFQYTSQVKDWIRSKSA